MVTFCCDGCGETLKKSKVDAHARRCRDCHSVSCVDCSVSFWGDDYKNHTSCISEAERYEKTVYKGNKKGAPGINGKKLSPQEAWLELIQAAASCAPVNIRNYMEELSSLDNVPRKEKPFRNFAMNSLRLRGSQGNMIIDSIWAHLSKLRQESQESRNQSQKEKQTEQSVDEISEERDVMAQHDKNDKGLRQQKDNCDPSTVTKAQELKKSKDLKKVIKRALKKSPKQKMKLKALRKDLKTKKIISLKKDEFKTMMKNLLGEQSSKFKVDGKYIALS